MSALRQLLVFLLVLIGGAYLLITYVPAARPYAAQLGLLDLFGIEASPEAPAAAAPGPRPGRGAALVVTAPVVEENLADRITALGDGQAKRTVTVRPGSAGVITQLSLPAGERVTAGTVLASLQDEAERIALQTAELQLEDAQAEQARVARLKDTGAVTEVRLRETELALRRAELAKRQAEFDLSQRQILAPISGWVGITDISVGDRVGTQDVLVTLTDRSEILVDFRLPDRVVNKLRLGKAITVTPLGLRDVELTGEISAIDSVIDRASRTLRVRGRVPNGDDLLRAGMAFSVSLTFEGAPLLSVAPLAVQWDSDGAFVWAVQEGKARRIAVEIVQRNSGSVLVRSEGLTPGQSVVTEGVQSLREGSALRVSNQAGSAETGADAGSKQTL
ncbi:efflux RND transporter periplasmic adaptor subunit [Sulfitobacter sp. PS-8MA]|uniref:efflux RND transporter periplasmic adaptor subunit n=1 Tax=Sulfitobacter sp. PS-8MA TaxID=3237707 RepID=UPI0034C67E14